MLGQLHNSNRACFLLRILPVYLHFQSPLDVQPARIAVFMAGQLLEIHRGCCPQVIDIDRCFERLYPHKELLEQTTSDRIVFLALAGLIKFKQPLVPELYSQSMPPLVQAYTQAIQYAMSI